MGRLKFEVVMVYVDGIEGLDNVNIFDYDFFLGIKGIGWILQELGLVGQGLSYGVSDLVMSVVVNFYFYVFDNFFFFEYWDWVEDWLYKICYLLNILGVKQLLLFFQLFIDFMALVWVVVGGMLFSVVISGFYLFVLYYRFCFMLDRVKELVGQVI